MRPLLCYIFDWCRFVMFKNLKDDSIIAEGRHVFGNIMFTAAVFHDALSIV